MKILLVFSFLLCSVFGYAQTTEEEYNYITTGYRIQVIEQGGDLKKGYTIKELGEWKLALAAGNRGVAFKALYRENESKPCAIMAIYRKYNKGGELAYSEYYCIPSDGTDMLWDKTISQLNTHYNEKQALEVYEVMLCGFMHLSSKLVTK